MPRAIAYLRISQEKADGGDWKQRQLEDSVKIANHKGAALADDDILIERFQRRSSVSENVPATVSCCGALRLVASTT
jgi:hypothetical protein